MSVQIVKTFLVIHTVSRLTDGHVYLLTNIRWDWLHDDLKVFLSAFINRSFSKSDTTLVQPPARSQSLSLPSFLRHYCLLSFHLSRLGVYQNIDTTIYHDVSSRGTVSIHWYQISRFNSIQVAVSVCVFRRAMCSIPFVLLGCHSCEID